jgi:hypothetical protein
VLDCHNLDLVLKQASHGPKALTTYYLLAFCWELVRFESGAALKLHICLNCCPGPPSRACSLIAGPDTLATLYVVVVCWELVLFESGGASVVYIICLGLQGELVHRLLGPKHLLRITTSFLSGARLFWKWSRFKAL